MKNKEIKILLSAPRGFCAGVERAIEIVKKSIKSVSQLVNSTIKLIHIDLENLTMYLLEDLVM